MSHSSTRKNFLLINADGALRQVIDGELTEDTLALVAAGELTCVIFDTTSSPPQFATLDEEGNTTSVEEMEDEDAEDPDAAPDDDDADRAD
jgi:hypothetical protein